MNSKNMTTALGLAAVAALGLTGTKTASAQSQPITPTGYFQQEYFNGGSSGFYFTTGSNPHSLTVDALGYLNYNPNKSVQALSADHQIGIYEVSTQQLVVSGTVKAGTTSAGTFAYVFVKPVALQANTEYAIAGTEYSSQGNTPSADADPFARPAGFHLADGYQYDGSAYADSGTSGTLRFPNVHNGDAGYFGPNFLIAPEPSSVAAFAFTGLGAAGLMLRARKGRNGKAVA